MVFKEGYVPWNKGLTKETDDRMKNASINMSLERKKRGLSNEHKKRLKEGLRKKGAWNKGLTKDTNSIIMQAAKNNSNERNGLWKGDKVGYSGLHQWIMRRLNRPEICPKCNQRKKLDLCNISGKYKRDLKDWKFLCHKCHLQEDWKNKEEKKNG